jgi:hypothetical protein
VIAFAVEPVASLWSEMEPLLMEDQTEVGFLPPGKLNPAREQYEGLEKAGALRVFTARHLGVLIGYNSFIIHPHLHYWPDSWASQDALYIRRQWRGRTAIRFILWTDAELANLGVAVIHRTSTIRREYGRTLERLGYKGFETSYLKSSEYT